MAFTDGLVEIEKNQQVESSMVELENIISSKRPIEEDIDEIKLRVASLVREGSVFDDIAIIGMGFNQ